MKYLEGLNEKQKEAVIQTEGPVLIVAGAGAGKTKTIIHRIMHLIENEVNPSSILAITFTNKAGREMKERIIKAFEKNQELFLKNGKQLPFIKTFHSLGVYIIKENSLKLGLPTHFTILDKSDSKKMIKNILEELSIEPKEYLDKVLSIISTEKSRAVDFDTYNQLESHDFTSQTVKKVWRLYEEKKQKEKSLDFDDLLLKTLWLLKKDEKIREYYQNKWQYIHIDEYQDTNKIQDEISNILAFKHHNIAVVGDTDQNIYSWRGADIKNMLSFEKRYPDTKIILLEQNYRSSKTIINVANDIISKNSLRIPKKLFTENKEGEKVSIYEAFNEGDEAYWAAFKIKSLIEKGVNPNEIAVLFRANFQSRIFEEAFLAYGVKYQMIGTKFFERKEIKDCLSYIKASLNTENLSDFLRIINTPPRGIGKTTVDKILLGQEDDLPQKTKEKIQNFKNLLLKIKVFIENHKVSESIKYILEISSMKDELEKSKKEEDMERLENLMELVSLSIHYDDREGGLGIEDFLTDTSLLTDEEEMKEDRNGVKLMTVHSAKGLEFEYVFIVGMEEDLFPHKRFNDKNSTKDDSEEERRLFYVAITRGKEKIYLTYSQTRTIFGERKINSPSSFLDDIEEKYIEKEVGSMLSPLPKKSKPYFSIEF
jgi:DNA helicase-2/ATP-dependent DNA helicase PcrA